MHRIITHGGEKLRGEIKISGSKNSAVALIPAAVLCDEEITIANVPNISDINSRSCIQKIKSIVLFHGCTFRKI